MFKKTLLTISLVTLVASNANSEIITMVEVPESMKKVLALAQEQVKKDFDELNNSLKDSGRSYELDTSENTPESFHISLIYIADGPHAVTKIKEKQAGIKRAMEFTASRCLPFNLNENMKDAYLFFLPGSRSFKPDEKPFWYAVIQPNGESGLDQIASNIKYALRQNKIQCKHNFRYSPHITIGKIYPSDIKPNTQTFRKDLEPLRRKKVFEHLDQENLKTVLNFEVSKFELKIDNDTKEYELGQAIPYPLWERICDFFSYIWNAISVFFIGCWKWICSLFKCAHA